MATTGRAVRGDKKGHIHAKRPRILGSLGITDTQWLALEIQQQSILMLNGLDTLVRIERREIRAVAKAA